MRKFRILILILISVFFIGWTVIDDRVLIDEKSITCETIEGVLYCGGNLNLQFVGTYIGIVANCETHEVYLIHSVFPEGHTKWVLPEKGFPAEVAEKYMCQDKEMVQLKKED